ncbi:MAG: fibronectin type III domain-containing protein [Spirochaetales bacterium]
MAEPTPAARTLQRVFVLSLLFVFGVGFRLMPASGFDEELVIGGEAGWDRVLSAANARFRSGRRGLDVAVLRDQSYIPLADTDLLLQFEGDPIRDAAGNYAVAESDVDLTTADTRRGQAAARFRGGETGLALRPGARAAFRPGRVWEDFAIEFWLHPARIQDGEQILRFTGALVLDDDDVLDQRVVAEIDRGRMRWRFENLFILPDLDPFDLVMEGRRDIVPGQWSHHRLEFSAETGEVAYLVDGQPEEVAWATEDGEPGGTVRIPHLGEDGSETLRLGSGFAGLIDEFRIEEFSPTGSLLDRYGASAGRVVTEAYDLGRAGARLREIELEDNTPGETDTGLFFRSGSSVDTSGNVDGDWQQIDASDEVAGDTAERFVQFRVELYPDGTGEESPSVERLTLRYLPNSPPGPPGDVRAVSGDGSATVRWNAAPGADVEGYRLYYGSEPGQYFGEEADEGRSPVDVGEDTEIELTGLDPGRLYYISVVAYDDVRETDGVPSEEISVRPR